MTNVQVQDPSSRSTLIGKLVAFRIGTVHSNFSEFQTEPKSSDAASIESGGSGTLPQLPNLGEEHVARHDDPQHTGGRQKDSPAESACAELGPDRRFGGHSCLIRINRSGRSAPRAVRSGALVHGSVPPRIARCNRLLR